MWTTALIAGVVGALLASGIGVATGGFGHSTVVRSYALASPATTVTEAAVIDPSVAPATSWAAIYQQLAQSMVMISGSGDAGEVSTSGMLWEESNSGTAYILCAGGDLDGVSSVNVAFASGYSARGKVVGADAQTGIAVVSVSERQLPMWGAALQFPPLGTLTDMHVGDALATVGSGSQANGSFVTGAVSSLDRAVTDNDDDQVMLGMIAVATAGPVIHGAAVVESNGNVVGLTVEGGAGDSNPQLLSYAVPIDVASDIATQIIDGQQPWHPWIGVLQAEDLPSGLPGGAEVDAIAPGSPAAKAGLQQTDVIVSLDGIPVDSTGSLLKAMNTCGRDTTVSLRYLRQGKSIATSVAVTAQPTNP